MNLNIFKTLSPLAKKYEPELLMATGISGMLFSIIWGVKATTKAVRVIDIAKENKGTAHLPKKEVVKETWKLYLPVVISAGMSIPCFLASNKVSNARSMALATAYTLSETAFQEYKNQTKDILSTKKFEDVENAVAKKEVEKTYKEGLHNVTIVGEGDSLFFEPLSSRYFKSSWNDIQAAANQLNAEALNGFCSDISLGTWYDAIGLSETDLDDTLGWSVSDGNKGMLDIDLSSTIAPNNKPCGAIRYNNRPTVL